MLFRSSNKIVTTTICNPLPQTDCTSCQVKDLSTDCSLYTGAVLPNSGILTNTPLTTVIQALDEYIEVATSQINDKINLVNTGTGVEIYSGINSLGKRKIRKLKSVGNIVDVIQNTDDITITIDEVELTNFVQNEIPSACITSIDTSVTIVENLGCFNLSVEKSPLQLANETNGDGIIIRGRDPLNYGNIGEGAIDFSYSGNISSVRGATGSNAFAMGIDVVASNFNSTVFGYLINNSGIGSFDNGFNLQDSGYTNSLFGIGHNVTSMNTTVVGQAANIINTQILDFNATPTKPLFVVGNGNIQNAENNYGVNTRSDALMVRLNGSVEAPSLTTSLINADITGKIIITKEYLNGVLPTPPDGSETKINSGTNITITGNGTVSTPYIINTPNQIVYDGSETKINSGTNIIITGNGTTATPYIINTPNQSTPDGSETKVIVGSGLTITGNGTIATPYTINSPKNNIINAGFFTGYDVGASNILTVGGDVATAVVSLNSTPDGAVIVTLVNTMPNLNYYIKTQIESLAGNINIDNDVVAPVFRIISTTQFELGFREVTGNVQNLRIHIQAVAY